MNPSASSFRPPGRNGGLLLAWLLLATPRVIRAEGSVTYQYEGYVEDGGRIAVQTRSAHVEQDLGNDSKVKLDGVIDAIAGATPNGQPAPAASNQVVLVQMHERRKAWNGELSHQLARVNLSLGAANSRESDYVSTGWSVNTVTDFNQKNTTLLAGVAGTDDDVKVSFQAPYAKKRTNDVIVGASQLLDPLTSVAFNVTWGRATGYLADPYKLVQKAVEIVPGIFLNQTFAENRPGNRDKWIALASVNRSFPELRGAAEGSYRFYHDTFGTDAHTVDLAWFQKIGAHFILKPGFRFYDQTAADFYLYRLDGTPVVPANGAPRRGGPFYSSDYRLSALRSYNYALKGIWTVTDWLQVDASIESYQMRGRDGVTPQSAYPRATIKTCAVKLSW
ncbi:MAG TPA: DUF3570 domain-containing protein [Opitutaceae bacterium]|nr:DUF3570 domain-containing protein [Opitutaceae bacterium]